jgi:hypothetical protein
MTADGARPLLAAVALTRRQLLAVVVAASALLTVVQACGPQVSTPPEPPRPRPAAPLASAPLGPEQDPDVLGAEASRFGDSPPLASAGAKPPRFDDWLGAGDGVGEGSKAILATLRASAPRVKECPVKNGYPTARCQCTIVCSLSFPPPKGRTLVRLPFVETDGLAFSIEVDGSVVWCEYRSGPGLRYPCSSLRQGAPKAAVAP